MMTPLRNAQNRRTLFKRLCLLSMLPFTPCATNGAANGDTPQKISAPSQNAPAQAVETPSSKFSFTPAGGEQGQRREEMLASLYKSPYPPSGTWNLVGTALASYWENDSERGDQAIFELQKTTVQLAESCVVEDGFHWQAFELERVLFLFGQAGVFRAGRMSPEAEKAAKAALWSWVEPRARAVLVDPSRDWSVWGSENHHLQMWFSLWGALNLFASDPAYAGRAFADGSTVPQLKKGFDDYFKRWIRNRATRGMFVECASPIYAKYSVSGFYNFVDFADDPELRRLSRNFLDLCWAQWALEQIDGVRGGSRHRSYSGAISTKSGAGPEQGWYHFGLGPSNSRHPAMWCAATSSYTPPPLVQEIAHHRRDLGDYQITSRQPGLAGPSAAAVNYVEDAAYPLSFKNAVTALDPACHSILRRTYATPSFILGATMTPALPKNAWTGISSQNRWDGVLFSGTSASRIFVQPKVPDKGSIYNAQWAVQDRGVLLVQRLAESNAKTSRVWFSKELARTEKDGWIFVEAPEAYACVKVVDGAWAWEPDAPDYWREKNKFIPGTGDWLSPAKEFSPIVIEVVPKAAYPDFLAFQKEITNNPLRWEAHRLDYTSRHYKTTLTLFCDYKQPPQIQGSRIHYEAPLSFDSPVIQSEFGGPIVHVKAFGKELNLSF